MLHNRWLIPWWYECGSSAGHPKGPTSGLKGGFLGGSPPRELPSRESLGCPLLGGW